MGRNLFRGSECFQSGKRQQLFLLRQSAQKRLAQLFRDRQNDGRQRREPLDMYRRRRTQLPGYPVGKVHALHAQRRRPAKHWKQQPEIHLFPSGNRNALYRRHLGGLYVLNVRTKQGHTLQHTKGDPHSLPNNIVNQIQPYQKGLLVLTQGGLVYMNRENEQFSDVSQNPEVRKVLRRPYAYETFLLDKHNRLWLGLSKGGVVCVDLTTSHISQYQSAHSLAGRNHPYI